MLKQLLGFLKPEEEKESKKPSPDLAAAALLVEIMHADFELGHHEREAIQGILKNKLKLPDDAVNELLKAAEVKVSDANDLFKFTEVINAEYSSEEKYTLVESLWEVAFSDNHLDQYEEHMVRRISDLLYVGHSDFMKAKHRVKERLGK